MMIRYSVDQRQEEADYQCNPDLQTVALLQQLPEY